MSGQPTGDSLAISLLPPVTAPSHSAAPGVLANELAGRGGRALLLADSAALLESRLHQRSQGLAGEAAGEGSGGRGYSGARSGVAMAGSPGSGASLEGISLGSSEEAELQREGRERWSGETGGKPAP